MPKSGRSSRARWWFGNPGHDIAAPRPDGFGRQLLRDVDHEDVRDADLGDVLAVENPAGRVRRGWMVLGLSRVVLRVSR